MNDNRKLTKAEIARINGAKSRGPTSPEGKAKSSQNAVKHGLTAKQFMSCPEDQHEFDLHLQAAIAHWNPQTDYELYLVTKIARVDFLHDRAEDIQNALLDVELCDLGPQGLSTFTNLDATGADAIGFRSLNDNSSAHRNMDRHIARLARERIQARKTLLEAMEYRRKLEAEQAAILGPEPKPVAAEPAPPVLQKEPTSPSEPPLVTSIDAARPAFSQPTDRAENAPEARRMTRA